MIIMGGGAYLDLLDWRRRVFALYEAVRRTEDPVGAWQAWRAARDQLFASHAQSPIPTLVRPRFSGLRYFDYNPAARVLADVRDADPGSYDIETSTGGAYRFHRAGIAAFAAFGAKCVLDLYWLDGYGGGLFLPFRDGTNGSETYGGGRYLFDTVKGADLGNQGGRLVLDFNFSYNPSCAYDPQWTCPLAPPANRLTVSVPAGERHRER